ncbi:MAG: hypothetical protein JWM82_771, partial [Myxococcales bacterium]|nr:hypothetical protein [Myxococcales bacterium]
MIGELELPIILSSHDSLLRYDALYVDAGRITHTEIDDAALAEAGDRGARRDLHAIDELAFLVDDVV